MPFELTADWRPLYGDVTHRFEFDPLHYGVGKVRQDEFKARIREETRQYGFLFTGEVGVRWDLFVDEQDRWESDSGADVDNFAKLLDDALVGPDGLLLDDSQVQRLEVAWLPALGEPSFELRVRCTPDGWLTRPISFYEMSDGLWYPLPDAAAAVPAALAVLLHATNDAAGRVRRVRAHMRRLGATRRQAFQATQPLGPASRGFHASRARTGQFRMVDRRSWSDHLPRPGDRPPDDEHDMKLARGLMNRPS